MDYSQFLHGLAARLAAVLAMNRQDASCVVPRGLMLECRAALVGCAITVSDGTPNEAEG